MTHYTGYELDGYVLTVVSLLDEIPHLHGLVFQGDFHLFEDQKDVRHQITVVEHANEHLSSRIVNGRRADTLLEENLFGLSNRSQRVKSSRNCQSFRREKKIG